MEKKEEQLETLREIRSLMENSSRFMSLSGLSGVIAGVAALCGIFAAYSFLGMEITDAGYYKQSTTESGARNTAFYNFFITAICLVLAVALLGASLMTIRKAKQHGRPVWDTQAKRMLLNFLIPLVAGALFCLILLYHHLIQLIAPATLLFYGLALLNASKYTLNDVRYLGTIQIVLGLIASFYLDYALLLWAFGFGIMHIVYGITMYYKYEK